MYTFYIHDNSTNLSWMGHHELSTLNICILHGKISEVTSKLHMIITYDLLFCKLFANYIIVLISNNQMQVEFF